MSEIPTTASQPEDHQVVDEPFAYTTPTGKSVVLKAFKRLPAGMFRKARSMNEIDSTFMLIEAATDEAGIEAVDEMEIGELEDLFTKWSAASGVELPQ